MKTNIKLGCIQIKDWKLGDKLYPEYYDTEEGWEDDAKEYSKISPKDVVLDSNKEIILTNHYPLTTPCTVKFKSVKRGMTRQALINKIVKLYRKVYQVEDSTTKTKAGFIPGMLNRNSTNGKFGIWGHSIGDLVLCDAHVTKNGKMTVGVDS